MAAFSDGSNTARNSYDQDGQLTNSHTVENARHYRRFDLSGPAGKTVSGFYLGADGNTPPGYWATVFQGRGQEDNYNTRRGAPYRFTGCGVAYDALGQRVGKQVGTDSTEYIYFNGQPIAERKPNGDWSDYIFANGNLLARADSYEDGIDIQGTNCSNCGWQYSVFSFTNAAGLSGYVLQPGDRSSASGRQRGRTGAWCSGLRTGRTPTGLPMTRTGSR